MNSNQQTWVQRQRAAQREKRGAFGYWVWRVRYAFQGAGTLAGALAMVAVITAPLAGWVTNVVWTFNQTEAVPLILGILGAIVFPIGAIHGIYLWF